jgi:peptidoglycan/LPS O-acetylase OafA/YrhL
MHALAFFCLCAACFRGGNPAAAAFAWTPLRWLGNMSYSYYLTHGVIVHGCMRVLARVWPGGLPGWAFWSAPFAIFPVTLGFAGVLFLFIEKPYSFPSQRQRIRRAAMRRSYPSQ